MAHPSIISLILSKSICVESQKASRMKNTEDSLLNVKKWHHACTQVDSPKIF